MLNILDFNSLTISDETSLDNRAALTDVFNKYALHNFYHQTELKLSNVPMIYFLLTNTQLPDVFFVKILHSAMWNAIFTSQS